MTRRSTEIEKVLGLIWNPDTDKYIFKLNLRFCKRSNEGHIKKAVKLEELDREIPSSLNKCIILSQVARLSTVTLKAKLMMRDLIQEASHDSC